MNTFTIEIDAWSSEAPIPAEYAFGRLDDRGAFALSQNRNPALRWSGAPQGTRSFALICYDPDVPSSAENVNQEGRTISAELPRIDFFHWLIADIPATLTQISAGAASDGVTPKGKPTGRKDYGLEGANSYTAWFADDPQMAGVYGGYDGPCPPWNDSIIHRYHFELLALDVETLGLSGNFDGPQLRAAAQAHVLGRATYTGTYTLNAAL